MNQIKNIHTLTTSSSNTAEYNYKYRSKRGGCKYPFPQRLFDLLEEADNHVAGEPELSSIISWNPNGKHFRVHNREEFEKVIQKKYFNQSKYASFRRQLNLWGFERIPDQEQEDSSFLERSPLYGGCFFHSLFQRNDRRLCCTMSRIVGRDGSKVHRTTNTFVTRSDAYYDDENNDASSSLFTMSSSGNHYSQDNDSFSSYSTSVSSSQASDGLDDLEPYDLMHDSPMTLSSSTTYTLDANTLLSLLNSSTSQEETYDRIPLGGEDLLLEQAQQENYGEDKGDDASSTTMDDTEFQELITYLSANDDNIQKYLFESC